MKVRLRYFDSERALPFCDLEPSEEAIEQLVALLGRKGGVMTWQGGSGGTKEAPTDWGFVLDDDGVYLEIVLGEEDLLSETEAASTPKRKSK